MTPPVADARRCPHAALRGRTAAAAERARIRGSARSGRSSARWTSTRRFRRALIDAALRRWASWASRSRRRYGGAGGTLLPRRARRRGAVARRPVGRRARGRAEHARHQRAAALGQRRSQGAAPAGARVADASAPTRCRRPASGSDAFALQTRAREDGDGFVLDGRKLWITNANEADLFIVFATVNPDAGYRGITAFIVERGTPGFTVGKKEDKLGIRASSTCELILEDCRVPARERARRGRQGLQGRDRDAERRPHRHRRADARPRRRRARPRDPLHEGAQAVRQGDRRLPGRAVPARARRRRTSRPRACSSTTPRACATPASRSSPKRRCASSSRRKSPKRAASLAVNLFGGNGFVKDYPVEKLYRDAKIGQIYEGTSNLQLQTIAKQLCNGLRSGCTGDL